MHHACNEADVGVAAVNRLKSPQNTATLQTEAVQLASAVTVAVTRGVACHARHQAWTLELCAVMSIEQHTTSHL